LLQSLGSLGGLAGAASGLKNPADQFLGFLKSQSVLDAMVERFKLVERYEVKLKGDARKTLLANTRTAAGKDGIISLEVDDKDPAFAAEMANAYVEELRTLMARLAITEAQQRRLFFETKVQESKADLAKADILLRATGVNASTLKSSPAAAVEGVARLKAAITAQEIKIGSMRGYLADGAPEIKQAMVELNTLRLELRKAEKDDPASSVGTAAASADSYIERFRDYKYRETLYELFTKQYELARVDESREGAVIQVVDAAQPPERKSKPKKAQIAVIATLAAGFALLLFVFVRQALANASQDPESAAKLAGIRRAFRRALGLRQSA
jgi:capsule polysaccharide export protein KpsE/RkpR